MLECEKNVKTSHDDTKRMPTVIQSLGDGQVFSV